MNLKIAAWAAIVNAILVIPATTLTIVAAVSKNPIVSAFVISLTILGGILFIPLMLGYATVAHKSRLLFLKGMAYVILPVGILLTIWSIVMNENSGFLAVIPVIVFGMLELIFGIAVLQLKRFGGIAIALGVLHIVQGIFLMTVLMAVLVPLTGIAIGILEAKLFFTADGMKTARQK